MDEVLVRVRLDPRQRPQQLISAGKIAVPTGEAGRADRIMQNNQAE